MSLTYIISYIIGLYLTVLTAFTCSLWGTYSNYNKTKQICRQINKLIISFIFISTLLLIEYKFKGGKFI